MIRDAGEHALEHRGGQQPGLGIVSTAVIAIEEAWPGRQFVLRAVPENVRRSAQTQGHENGRVGHLPEREHRSARVQRSALWARWLARFARRLFACDPIPARR